MAVKFAWGKVARKQWKGLPVRIKVKLSSWMESVRTRGLEETRRYPSYHDEALQGERWGQRSIRLNRAYRVIYREFRDESGVCVQILEVTHHEY